MPGWRDKRKETGQRGRNQVLHQGHARHFRDLSGRKRLLGQELADSAVSPVGWTLLPRRLLSGNAPMGRMIAVRGARRIVVRGGGWHVPAPVARAAMVVPQPGNGHRQPVENGQNNRNSAIWPV